MGNWCVFTPISAVMGPYLSLLEVHFVLVSTPIGSMYVIFTYTYNKNQPTVGKYTFRPMDPPMGNSLGRFFPRWESPRKIFMGI